MTDFRLRLIIETILKDEKLLKTLKKDLEGIDTSAKKGSSGLTSFSSKISAMKGQILGAGAILAGFGLAVKKAFDLSLQGAEIVTLTSSFDGLMERLGVGSSLLEELRAAAQGTIPDFELMSSTMTLIMGATGELQDSLLAATPALLEMAKAANKLNPALGSTTFLYESLARGIKRASPLILDNLGVIIKVGEAYRTYADSVGKTIEELTAADKTQAVLVAALAAGIPLIDQAGGSVDTYADSWRKLSTNIINSKNDLLVWLADAANPVITALDVLFFGNKMFGEELEKVSKELALSDLSAEEYAAELERLAKITRTNVLLTFRRAKTQEELNAIIKRSKTGLSALDDVMIIYSETVRQNMRDSETYADTLARVRKEVLDNAIAADKFNQELEEQQKALDDQALIDYAKAVEDAEKALNDARDSFIQDPFSNIDTGFLSSVEDWLKSFKFAEMGGQLIADLALGINAALFDERITEAQAFVLVEAIQLAGINLEIELGNLSLEDAAIHLAKTLGIDPSIAEQMLSDAIPVDVIVANLDTAIQDTADTLLRLEDRVAQGLPGADDALASFLDGMSKISETASTMKSTIAEEFGIAEEDIDLVSGAFERLQESADISKQEIIDVKAAIDALSDKRITIYIDYVTTGTPPTGTNSAHGFNQIIPPGYPNDSYFLPLNVQSGEVVTVTPQGRTPTGTGNNPTGEININAPIYLNSEANLSIEEMVRGAIPQYNI